jgi:hypothetical protein
MRLNGIEVHVENEDFGGILDWFSSSSKISKEEEIRLGQSWVNSLYNELKPNATYQTYIEALKLDSYNQKIPEEDYRDFLSTVGFNVNVSKTISDKVRAAVVASLKNNKNGLPSRKSIISAFLNPNNIKITYWDATKILASNVGTEIKSVASDVASVTSGGLSVLSFVVKYRGPIIVGLLGIGAWLAYTQRAKIKERLTEKALSTVGLGA